MSIDLASVAVAKKHAQVQLAVAAKLIKMNNNSEKAVGDLVKAANQNLQKIVSSTAPGVGANLDISV